ncbi:MAG TPA: hypothetical protein PKJ41_10385, partial [Bryobacteraceae bacterium]|nr:hypothetical protein [Bryobacteraceae bacterium]
WRFQTDVTKASHALDLTREVNRVERKTVRPGICDGPGRRAEIKPLRQRLRKECSRPTAVARRD